MKKIGIVLLLCSMSYALNAPYLISATATSDSTVSLSWRNNDIATTGFIVMRKDSTESAYKFIDSVKSVTQLTYTDTKGLKPAKTYTYQVTGYNATDISDTSNSLQITMPNGIIFKTPTVSIYWDLLTSVTVNIRDFSNNETGYLVYRADGSSSFKLVSQIISANPKDTGEITWNDSGMAMNTWCIYKIAVYSGFDSLYSAPCTTYTLHSINQQKIVRFTKLSDFPVTGVNWSAKSGDSIILKEANAPIGKYTIIDVKDPSNPKFEGYTDSSALLSYPIKTMIPVFLNFNISNSYVRTQAWQFNDKMVILTGSTLKMYKIQDNNLIDLDTMYTIKNFKGSSIIKLGDTTILAGQYAINSYTSKMKYYFTGVQLSSTGFLPLQECYLDSVTTDCIQDPYQIPTCTIYYNQFNFRGTINNNILISDDNTWNHNHNEIIYDMALKRIKTIGIGRDYGLNSYNTGYYISPTENLCTNYLNSDYSSPSPTSPTELFVADIRNLYSHSFDSTNNALYVDSVHKQNTLQNIFLDTLGNNVFLVFNSIMTILSYQRDVVGVNRPSASRETKRFMVHPSSFGTTFILPNNNAAADLFIYDLAGHMVDKMQNITSNAVFWRPKSKSMNFYIAVVRSEKQQYVTKFMIQ